MIFSFRKRHKLLFLLVFVFLFSSLVISFPWIRVHFRQIESNSIERESIKHESIERESVQRHRLAVLVPFRNRFKQLIRFVPHLSRFLNDQNIDYRILILHQIDSYRFNRAALINAGYRISLDLNCDHLVMHDVDLLPLNPELKYMYPEHFALHLSPSGLHPKYAYERFVGGVLLLSHLTFAQLNGMSNRYWGWGQEDDEFYLRLLEHQVPVS